MGERIQIIAKIVFALMFVAILSTMFLTIMDMGHSVNGQLVKTNRVTQMHELQAFDGTTVTGATVISAIKNYDNLCKTELSIRVITTEEENVYGKDGIEQDYENPSSDYYINPTSVFRAELVYNANGVVTGIEFSM